LIDSAKNEILNFLKSKSCRVAITFAALLMAVAAGGAMLAEEHAIAAFLSPKFRVII